MSGGRQLELEHEAGRSATVRFGGAVLLRYIYAPATPDEESPRPYAHPVNSLAGDALSAFRPNDHPWHHGLSLALTRVGGVNFWGGPSYLPADGYQWRGDQGRQVHEKWLDLGPARLRHTVAWRAGKTGETLLEETRELSLSASERGWTLDWTSRLSNVSGRALEVGNYEAAGLAGSHYSGLQFRGARALLDEHGDRAIRLCAEGGLEGEKAVHGAPARWMEWRVQSDESLRRAVIRFESPDGPIPWFVRRSYPLAVFAPQREAGPDFAPGGTWELRHRLAFLSES